MVDAIGKYSPVTGFAAGRETPRDEPSALQCEVSPLGENTLAAYTRLCAAATPSPQESVLWIENWAKHVNPDMFVAFVMDRAEPVFALPLEIVDRRGYKLARFPGGGHANSNFPPFKTGFGKRAGEICLRGLIAEIKRTRPDIDLLLLERQLPDQFGIANPLAILGGSESPDIALAADLEGGFDAVLEKVSAKRKRKKHRSHARKFESAGGFRRFQARTEAEVDAVLDFFFVTKAERFRKAGINNVFGDPRIQAFFRALFRESARLADGKFVLHALEVGGNLRAVTGASITGNRITSEFGAIADDDGTNTSPGEFLYFDNILEACDEGFAVYDFSVGDEPYKRQWCTIESPRFDTAIPLSIKGRIVAMALKYLSNLKRYLKRNSRLRSVYKEFRARIKSA